MIVSKSHISKEKTHLHKKVNSFEKVDCLLPHLMQHLVYQEVYQIVNYVYMLWWSMIEEDKVNEIASSDTENSDTVRLNLHLWVHA